MDALGGLDADTLASLREAGLSDADIVKAIMDVALEGEHKGDAPPPVITFPPPVLPEEDHGDEGEGEDYGDTSSMFNGGGSSWGEGSSTEIKDFMGLGEDPPKKYKFATGCRGDWTSLIATSHAWRTRFQTGDFPGLANVCTRECGGGGDCLFHAIARGFHMYMHPGDELPQVLVTPAMMDVRRWAASFLTADNIEDILKVYGREWFTDLQWKTQLKRRYPYESWSQSPDSWSPSAFGGTHEYKFPSDESIPAEWRGKTVTQTFPFTAKSAPFLDVTHPDFQLFQPETIPAHITAEADRRNYSARHFKAWVLRQAVMTRGEKFRGDDRTLEWLVNGNTPLRDRDMGFIVLSSLGQVNCSLYPSRIVSRYMLLYSMHNAHFQLLGVSSDVPGEPVQCVFEADAIPLVIQQLWVADCVHSAAEVAEMERDMVRPHPMLRMAREKYSKT